MGAASEFFGHCAEEVVDNLSVTNAVPEKMEATLSVSVAASSDVCERLDIIEDSQTDNDWDLRPPGMVLCTMHR